MSNLTSVPFNFNDLSDRISAARGHASYTITQANTQKFASGAATSGAINTVLLEKVIENQNKMEQKLKEIGEKLNIVA